MSRDEYLQSVEEGFIKDTIKKGWEKVKSIFKIGIKKIRNFIAVFDNKGHVLPVITPQAIIDKFAGSDVVKVYASKSMNDSVVEAGGNKGGENPTHITNNEIYNCGPDGKAYWDWMEEKKYKDSIEYKNFLKLSSILEESNQVDNENILDESWEAQQQERARYVANDAVLRQYGVIDYNEFRDILNEKITDWSVRRGKVDVRASDGKVSEPLGNILVFGALGIGKSTIPNMVVDAWNEKKEESDMISIISVNCANIGEGDFLMPTLPKEVHVMDEIEKFAEAFPEASSALKNLSSTQREEIATTIYNSGQFRATDAPKTWLPSYKETGDDLIDKLLNDAANGGVYKDSKGNRKKVGGGGIIIFDEFLRCNEGVMGQLMNFLLDRKLNGWTLGDRWTIIACSNRPSDDDDVAEKFSKWSPAAKDRWAEIYQLEPDPESWKEYMRSKGADQLILDFIFEEDSSDGSGEYPRWHTSVAHGADDSAQGKPLSPRNWDRVISKICRYEVRNKLDDISQIKEEELKKLVKGTMDEDFNAVFLRWIKDHCDKIDLDAIIKDPKSVYLPKKFMGDEAKAKVLIRLLYEEMEKKFKKDPSKLTDEILSQIIIWLGINYKGEVYAVSNLIDELSRGLYKEDGGPNSIINKVHSALMMRAAFPFRDLDKEIKEWENYPEKSARWPKGSKKIIMDLMKENFPWRLKGDKIRYYDDLDLEDTDYEVKNSPVREVE